MDEEKLGQAINIFAHRINNQYFYIDKAWFYGSRFRRENRPDSDYDIAIQIVWKVDTLNRTFEEIIEQRTGEKVKIDIKFYDEYKPECTPEVYKKMKKGNVIIFNCGI